MRVTKRASKRRSTRMREGLKKKVAAHGRKQRKLEKKDPTWKSRVRKDPGIPASFPYKEAILAEIEQKRREDEEEKLALKEKRRAEAAAARSALPDDENLMDDESDEDNDGANGLAALLQSAQQAAKAYDGTESNDEMEEDDLEVNEYEIDFEEDERLGNEWEKSRKAFDKIFKTVVEASDVILYVLDARDPEGTRSKKIEEAILQSQGKRLIFVLNKIDLVPDNVLKMWLDFLQSSFPTVPLKANGAASTTFNKKMTQAVTSKQLLESLKSYAHKSNLKRAIIVGVVGYPNVGKSSIINALTSRHGGNGKACPVGNQAGVTTSMREVKVDNKLKILDSPGIVFPSSKKSSKESMEAKLALLSAIPSKQIKDPEAAIQLLLKRLAKNTEMADGFKKYYDIPPLVSSDLESFTKGVLIHIARKQGKLGKGGIPKLNDAALVILNDWRDGKIVGWTLPNSSKAAQVTDNEVSSKVPPLTPSSEQTTIVKEWAKEFDLDGLLNI
ncbi:GTPase that associates with nuclear 60S pre-ribosomes [Komagataella phaffii CBS 7435]|uniref:GTPase that associates with nuclear 60S pre-ribosomes, required for export of 60S ribosomal subunits n=2 Tax=Komagataella phaffii TaxID=460519 RepID=C4QVZ3_KOMPG|nr:uncharacterized protein PAS_chr1-1_0058 [Komagataella phaffii GS115]AOA61134.1 GQ67_02621T0 [Komagataella phaffii]CAH2446080.1 GTPase that associates with nuclear 60S pre-ribosomes [Komagataella phaffii CBS 7435]AOA66126.1 GQ68_02627T0 [Komagataella phaffii GS115]CAY67416.1 GTPase that associates with nuclear 60S pre-ribosomes, required for export of 60S ribosomal subunits [Komagataella phaffii GS115]CCA36516.1 GTPase that associates with nuclear 60S pre-ribosomes [Komagataella phaffii CBS 